MDKLKGSLPSLTALLPFEAALRLGSITRAADELCLTQAAISKQIRALEEDLGVRLFERRNRAIYPTDDGRTFGRIVADALGSIADFSTQLRHRHKNGEVVLRAQLCEGLYWLMPRLSGFYQKHPNIAVRVSVSTAPITETDERFDLALQTSSRAHGNAKLAFSVVDDVFPICSPVYLQDNSPPLSVDRLKEFRLLHHKAQPQDWIDWDDWLAQIGADIRVGYCGEVYDSYPMMMQAVLEGHGIAIGWRRTTEQLLDKGAVIRPFAESVHLPDGLSVYFPSEWPMRKEAAVLLEWLREELD